MRPTDTESIDHERPSRDRAPARRRRARVPNPVSALASALASAARARALLASIEATRLLRYLTYVIAIVISAEESRAFIRRMSFVIHGVRYDSLFDDGMISMRYAYQLVHGHGLVWNPGERVEGFTDPLWVLVMAVCIALTSQIKAVLAMQRIGAVLILASSVVYARLAGRLLGVQRGLLVPLLEGFLVWVIARIFPLRFWSHLGMEVSLLTFLGSIAWYIALTRPPGSSRAQWLGALAAVAYLTRPDGFLVMIPALGLAVLEARGGVRPRLRALAHTMLPLIATAVVVTAARYAYYGDYLPNTYRLKMGQFPLGFRLENGWAFLTDHRRQATLLYIFGAAACLARRNARTLALFGSPIVLYAYQVYVGGDPWPFWRQLAPGYPSLVLLAVLLADSALRFPGQLWTRLRLRFLRHLAPVAAAALSWYALAPTEKAFADGSVLAFHASWNETNVRRALVFRKIMKPEARIAVFWAGTTPYYDSKHWALDLLGKCDRHVASLPPDLSAEAWDHMKSVPGHNKSDINYTLAKLGADYTEVLDWSHDHARPEVRAQFEAVKIDGHYFQLRRGSPHIRWDVVRTIADDPSQVR